MTLAVRPVLCQLKGGKPLQRADQADNGKIVLQPRVCTLRAFGGERGGAIKVKTETNRVSRFYEALSDYIESSQRSHDFEIISGRLAMVVFAATVGMEVATGNSVFKKMDLQGIAEAVGVCSTAIASAAIFASFSTNRNRVGRILTTSCNTFIDSLIDHIIDGLFYDTDASD